ncbi:hypothetical protein GEMRC1_013068 [Eukaryota sp. GEM-RC1]
MELSELISFNNKVYSCDDRTGIVYEVLPNKALRRIVLNNGDGDQQTGFKCEWMTVKDGYLYVGSIGKEWTFPKNDTVRNDHTLYIKRISSAGKVTSLPFHDQYQALRQATGTVAPGYLIHEAVAWSNTYRRWFFLPRRVSKERYNDDDDERRGSNLVIIADEKFQEIEVRAIGPKTPTRGFSSLTILPRRPDTFAVLKSEEVKGKIASYISILNIDGRVMLKEQKIGPYKYEGIEVVPDDWCLEWFNKKR